ncbi:sensor histidine kinase [Paenibacillaceae bacterium WGS1546]|uniref:cache domain-containing sensor histidine kinase n=1 Tax=Cohnella sp. WGS1546 TaxID=3366810 RepID=UPI00372D19E9
MERKRSLVRWFTNQELARKLILINFLLVVVPIGAMGIYAFSSFENAMEKNVGAYQLQTIRQISLNIDTYMNELNRLTVSPYQYDEVLEYLSASREPGQPLTLEQIGHLNDFVSKIFINGRIDIMGVSLYGQKGASYVVMPDSQYVTTYRLDESAEWLERAKSRYGQPTFIATHQIESTSGMTYDVFSIARELRSFDSGETIGYIVIDIDPSAVRSMLQQVNLAAEESMYIVDQHGGLVLRREAGDFLPEIGPLQGQGVMHVDAAGAMPDSLVAHVTSPVTGWTLVGVVPVKELMRDSHKVRSSMTLVIVGFVGLAMLLNVVVAFRVTHPLRKLSRLMRKVEQGELRVTFPVTGQDEVGRLGGAFNTMVSKLSELGYLLYETEIREKDAQIAALQSKINPHFLYNTLGTISMNAELEGNRDIVTMANNLSRILRYSLSSRQEIVTLRDELNHVNGYMSIQTIRYEERIRFRENVDGSALDCVVIPLIVQPIVENAINHGLDRGAGAGLIRLTGAEQDGMLTIVIEDDGIGMSDDELEAIRSRLRNAKDLGGKTGNGLLNVHRRIRLHYGEPYGLTFESMLYQGLKVTITLPAVRKSAHGSSR